MTALRDHSGWWMQVRCECMISSIPVRMLIERHGPDADPAAIAKRLRCSRQCGQRPYSVALVEDPRSGPKSRHYPVETPPVALIGTPFERR